jgi:hydroxymethylbilane synthase
LRVGTRGSILALIQTRAVITRLTASNPALGAVQEQVIGTTGDAVQHRRLAEIGGKGLFAKEIHEALLDGRVDLAVHSLKDLETELPRGIVLACVLPREDARDALVLPTPLGDFDPSAPYRGLAVGAVIGTSSVRRQAQLLHARPDLRVVMLRGNVQTRLAKLANGDCQATLLAMAGLNRLGLEDRASIVLDPEMMVPAAGQGIIGVTAREDDHALRDWLAAIDDPAAATLAMAERALLAALDGSCRTPIGGHARIAPDGTLRVTGLIARADGSYLLKRDLRGNPADAARIGAELGGRLRAEGPRDLFA